MRIISTGPNLNGIAPSISVNIKLCLMAHSPSKEIPLPLGKRKGIGLKAFPPRIKASVKDNLLSRDILAKNCN